LKLSYTFAATGVAVAASASATIDYAYDARGRLVKVERYGAANKVVTVEYSYDKADNRATAKATGPLHPPPP
jgi:hypothetical protein